MSNGPAFDVKQAMAIAAFMKNHPKVPEFIGRLKEKGICEGAEIAVAVRYPDGTENKTGIRVQASDLDALSVLREMGRGGR